MRGREEQEDEGRRRIREQIQSTERTRTMEKEDKEMLHNRMKFLHQRRSYLDLFGYLDIFGYMASSGYYWVYWDYSFAARLLVRHRSFWMLRQSVLRICLPSYEYPRRQRLRQLWRPIASKPPDFQGFLAFPLQIFIFEHAFRTSIYTSIDSHLDRQSDHFFNPKYPMLNQYQLFSSAFIIFHRRHRDKMLARPGNEEAR